MAIISKEYLNDNLAKVKTNFAYFLMSLFHQREKKKTRTVNFSMFLIPLFLCRRLNLTITFINI